MAIIFIIFIISETPNEEITNPKFTNAYGIIVEKIDITKPIIVKAFYPLYLIRRFIYAILLVCMHSYPIYQLVIIIFCLIIPVFSVLILDDPLLSYCESI